MFPKGCICDNLFPMGCVPQHESGFPIRSMRRCWLHSAPFLFLQSLPFGQTCFNWEMALEWQKSVPIPLSSSFFFFVLMFPEQPVDVLEAQDSINFNLLFIYFILASLVAKLVKNLPAMQETQVQSLGGEDPWRREWLPTPVFLPGEFRGQRSLVGYSPWSPKELEVTEQLTFSLFTVYLLRFLYMSVGVVVKISSPKFLLSIWVIAAVYGDRMEVESAPAYLIHMELWKAELRTAPSQSKIEIRASLYCL